MTFKIYAVDVEDEPAVGQEISVELSSHPAGELVAITDENGCATFHCDAGPGVGSITAGDAWERPVEFKDGDTIHIWRAFYPDPPRQSENPSPGGKDGSSS